MICICLENYRSIGYCVFFKGNTYNYYYNPENNLFFLQLNDWEISLITSEFQKYFKDLSILREDKINKILDDEN
jgi:hypothetical protein